MTSLQPANIRIILRVASIMSTCNTKFWIAKNSVAEAEFGPTFFERLLALSSCVSVSLGFYHRCYPEDGWVKESKHLLDQSTMDDTAKGGLTQF